MVNDRLDVALAAGAHGVHLKDGPAAIDRIRTVAPGGFLVGQSIHSPERVEDTQADYLVFGTLFPTRSKPEPGALAGLAGLAAAVRRARVPVLGIGGVKLTHLAAVAYTGAAGVAAVDLFLPRRTGSGGTLAGNCQSRPRWRLTLPERLPNMAQALRDPVACPYGIDRGSGRSHPSCRFLPPRRSGSRRTPRGGARRVRAARAGPARNPSDPEDDADPEIAREAIGTIERLPEAALSAFLGRSEVPTEMRAFFEARGTSIGAAAENGDDPLIDVVEGSFGRRGRGERQHRGAAGDDERAGEDEGGDARHP